jgi:hypothetical protein
MAVCKNILQSVLVAAALAFEPFQHVGITPNGMLLLDGPEKLAALCAQPVFARRPG